MKWALICCVNQLTSMQSQTTQRKPSFQVASIKQNTTGRNPNAAVQPNSRFVGSQTTLRQLNRLPFLQVSLESKVRTSECAGLFLHELRETHLSVFPMARRQG